MKLIQQNKNTDCYRCECNPKVIYSKWVRNKVVHCKKEPYDIYIGRPSKWGNPFKIGPDGTREQVIEKYRQWIKTQPELLKDLPELENKVLGCWCRPHPCHGDVLLELIKEI